MSPDTLAKSNTEHAQQRALFAWANVAARFGFYAAWDDECYTKQGYAELHYGPKAQRSAPPSYAPVPALALLFAIPNGGLRDKITAARLKAEGVKKGVPDVFLPMPQGQWAGLFVELKRPATVKAGKRKAEVIGQTAGSTSAEQDEWIANLRRAGYGVAVAFTWRDAAKQLQSYIEWKA